MSGSGRRLFVSRRSFVDPHRQLAGLGLEERAFGADDVAEVEVLERGVVLLAEGIDCDEELDPAGRVLQGREARLAHHALQHQPAGDRHLDRQRLELLVRLVAVLAHQLGGAVARLEVVRERDAAGAGSRRASRGVRRSAGCRRATSSSTSRPSIPGVTEEVCGPILAKVSGLKQGKDFKLGYSPERINPGDKEHTLERITKVVSGEDAATLERVADAYGAIVEAGVHRAARSRSPRPPR